MKKIIATMTVIITLSSFIAVWVYMDERWAHAEDVEKLSQRLDNKIAQDRIDYLDQRIWKIEDRYPKGKMPIMVLDQYRGLKKERAKLEQKMKKETK